MLLNNLSLTTSTTPTQYNCCVAVENDIVEVHSNIKLEMPEVNSYVGPYEITPSNEEQILSTKNMNMRNDVTVYGVPFHMTPGLNGGYTLSIG